MLFWPTKLLAVCRYYVWVGNYSLEDSVRGYCKVRIFLTKGSWPLVSRFKGGGKIVFGFTFLPPCLWGCWYDVRNTPFMPHAKASKIVCHSSLSILSLKLSYLASLETRADNTPGPTELHVLPVVFHIPRILSLPSVKCYQLLRAYKCSLYSSYKNEPGLDLVRSHSMPFSFQGLHFLLAQKFFIWSVISQNHCEVRRISERTDIPRWEFIHMFKSCWVFPIKSLP